MGTHIVLLSGGSGTRLWPLSSGNRAKQFLKILRDEDGNHISMVQRTYALVSEHIPNSDVTIATCASQANLLADQVEGDYALAVEPERRDTAPAIMLACAHLYWSQHASLDDPVIVMPIDSYAGEDYCEALMKAAQAVKDDVANLVLVGVEPTEPSEKFGYIVPASPMGSPRQVERFVEKPSEEIARDLIARGALWNCGVFAFRLSYAISILERYGFFSSYTDVRKHYDVLPKNSFDCEIVEKEPSVAAISYSGTWTDLGTWGALTEEMEEQTSGRVVLDGCENTHVINELDAPVIVSGIDDAVVVVTSDGVLVCAKSSSSSLKRLVRNTIVRDIDDATSQ